MKTKIKKIITKKQIPVTKTIEEVQEVTVYEITRNELVSAFKKWNKDSSAEIGKTDYARASYSIEENADNDANSLIYYLTNS